MDKRHLLVCGERGAGKSTLIARLLAHTKRPRAGFMTKRWNTADEQGVFPVHIHPAAQGEAERERTRKNLVGECDSRSSRRFTETFETLGVEYLRASEGSVIVMDELGFLENDAAEFRASVLRALEGDIPVIAAVKTKDTEFLRRVRESEKAQVVSVTQENRDALYEQLVPFVRAWDE